MTKNNSLQKTTILMVLLLLLVIGCVLLFLLFIYPQVFVLGVSVDEKYGTDYQGLGSARIIPRSSGEEIRIEGDSIVLPDGFYDSNYEVVELYDETELQSGGRRGSTKGDECVRDRDCGSTKTKEYCYFGSVYEETTTYSCTNGYCESDKDKEKIEICQYGCSNALCLQNCVDADGDGYDTCGPQAPNDDGKPVDCNDNNNKIHPNAVEICDGKDNDCDGQIDEGSSICGVNQVCSQGMCAAILCTGNSDCGSDGFIGSRYCQGNTVHQDFKTFMCANAGSASSSCSSTTNSVPIKQCAGNEMCSNGACVGVTCSTTQDCGTSDFEGNTFCQNGDVYKNFRSFMCSNAGKPTSSCSSSTSPQLFDDCNSGEVCSNGACINKCSDNDTDGFDVCQTGTPGDDGKPVDCNDNNAGINPGASDVQCNGVDNDCDGQIDEGYVTATTNCGVGECGRTGMRSCVNGNEVNSCVAGNPVAEICDGKDNDCDAQIDDQCTIFCNSNAQCGTDGFSGNKFCKSGNLYQKFTAHMCTQSNSCTSQVADVLVKECGSKTTCDNGQCIPITCDNDSHCNDGNSLTIDTCVNKGTVNSFCQNTPIVCSVNSDCGTNGFVGDKFCTNEDVSKNFVTYTCLNSGTINAVCKSETKPKVVEECDSDELCSSGSCVPVVCQNANDCGTDDFVGQTFCQNGDVYKNFKTYMCTKPGTTLSSCSSNINPTLIEDCKNGCSNGQCNPPVICSVPATKVFGGEPWGVYGVVQTEIRRQGQPSPTDIFGVYGGSAFVNDYLTNTKVCNIMGYATYINSDGTSSDGRIIWTNGGDRVFNWNGNNWQKTDDLASYRNPNHISWLAGITCSEPLICAP